MLDELQSLVSNMNQQGQGDSTKTCINEVIDKICDLLKCTAKRVFPTKNRNSLCNKSDKPWFNKRALKSVKNFTLQKIDIVLLNIKQIVMLRIKQEMNKSYQKHEHTLGNKLPVPDPERGGGDVRPIP